MGGIGVSSPVFGMQPAVVLMVLSYALPSGGPVEEGLWIFLSLPCQPRMLKDFKRLITRICSIYYTVTSSKRYHSYYMIIIVMCHCL